MALQHASRHDPPWLDLQAIEAWAGGQRIVEDLSLRLWVGESTAILGPNGAGKSTLVKLISRCLHPVVQPQSHLRLFGEERINLWSLRERLGVVDTELQQRIPDAIPCRELLLSAFFGAIGLRRGLDPSAEHIQQSADALEQFNLSDLATCRFGRLSDGQKRSVLIARAMVHQPQVLVLDEPTNALDLRAKHGLLAQLRQLCRAGTTVILITHQIDAIIPEISRVVGMRQGGVVVDGAPTEVLNDRVLSELFQTPLRVLESGGYRQVLPA